MINALDELLLSDALSILYGGIATAVLVGSMVGVLAVLLSTAARGGPRD